MKKLILILTLAAAPAFAQTTTITKIDTTSGLGKVILPLRSASFESSKHTGTLFTPTYVAALADTSYAAECATATNSLRQSQSFYRHTSDIPELDVISRRFDDFLKSVSCTTLTQNSNNSGIHWSEGSIEIEFDRKLMGGSNNRHIYDISFPVKYNGYWDQVQNSQAQFRESCQVLKQSLGNSSTLFAHCLEPLIESNCCGNMEFNGEFRAVVFAYGTPIILESTHTDLNEFAVRMKNYQYISEQLTLIPKVDYVTSFCTPVAWQYSAFQSKCYFVKQQFVSQSFEKYRCFTEIEIDAITTKIWAAHASDSGKDYLRFALSGDLTTDGWYPATLSNASGSYILTDTTGNITLDFGNTDPNAPITSSFTATLTAVKEQITNTTLNCAAVP